MRKSKIGNDPLEQLFARAREERVPDAGFTQRIVGRIVLPPSRSSYRIPTLAAAFASVLVIVWMAFSGFSVTDFTVQLPRASDREGVRLVPKSWVIAHTLTENANTPEHADN